jgi:hypothetical protein
VKRRKAFGFCPARRSDSRGGVAFGSEAVLLVDRGMPAERAGVLVQGRPGDHRSGFILSRLTTRPRISAVCPTTSLNSGGSLGQHGF